ncbi:ranBP-type and C3HC4-type zinc finger-containing protein 1 isoform X1 [Hippocampus comes]|uniref:ranBP-type and C3HC4-type zinc finger-containing protein 1 isoform X1 n=2 Tax=Hippocampus comes TaxID=109280 RepID=UPI00094E726E|nr:PREDICTED: ranBP-type and C3HC4-type zinc finger-containing protein 1 isoform X1 [Hippocampus comes]XP_019734927.1 PREDICTED: ranBP-type and C3HC4-type zinc finger-containing protein 1 isoform X1 [Hippocampus comes]
MATEATPTPTLEVAEELARRLSEALSTGNEEEAVTLSRKLCRLSLPVCVSIGSQDHTQDSIRLVVGVEDAQSDAAIPITLLVSCGMTISQLKDEIDQKFGFPPALQRWVIGKRLACDHETLRSHGIRHDGDWAFLFLLSGRPPHLNKQPQQPEGVVESTETVQVIPPPPPQGRPRTPQPGWECPRCTFINKPTRPGCQMCDEERPEDYQVPEGHKPVGDEALRIQNEKLATFIFKEVQQAERQINYLNLVQTDDQSLIPTTSETTCPICFSTLEPGEGVVLRECLHTFCRECLRGTILNCADAEVSCPEECEMKLVDREIKALLTAEEHERFLEQRLSVAESRLDHTFHCRTPNCRGWCIYEDEVNHFQCQLCSQLNCLLCKAIHKDMNCQEYQDDLRTRAEKDHAVQQTQLLLEGMLRSGKAMNCPQCDITIQKKDGCDWLRCSVCRTEICWVTKQARWGPNGRGDTSGGCHCGVNDLPCHPNCMNCH